MALRVHTDDPSALLEAAFLRVERDCMSGVPLLNPALKVQAVGFARWQQQWLGALITPWFLNLVLVPGDLPGWQSVVDGKRRFLHFGAGDFAFLNNHEPEVGEFQTASLFSPMAGFVDQATACATARAALRALHTEPASSGPAASSSDRVKLPRPILTPEPTELTIRARREFLFGRRSTLPRPA